MSLSTGAGGARVKTITGWDQQSGFFTEEVYRGTSDYIDGVLGDVSGYTAQTRDPTGPVHELRVRYAVSQPGGVEPEIPVREERLHWNRPTQSIFKSPRWGTGQPTGGIDNYAMDALRKAIEERVERKDMETRTFKGSTGIPTLFGNDALLLYDLHLAGVESAYVYQPIVIVTHTASVAFQWTPSFVYYGWVFTTRALMIADAGLVSGWKANLPNETSPKARFTYGWLKSAPEITTVAGGRTQLIQEYEYGLWSDDLFQDLYVVPAP